MGERFSETDDTWAIHFKDGYCQGKLLVGVDWQGARGCIGGEPCIAFWRYSVDEVAPTSSVSSSSTRLLLSLPKVLIGGSEIHFGSIHLVQPGLSSPSMSDSEATRIVAVQLRKNVW